MINKTGRIGKLFKSYGLAQIPLLIGLLIMAIAVPVATKLVEENQDTRNLAAVCSPVGEFCLTTSNCCSGQCVNNICGGGYVPPTAVPTKPPTAVPTKVPSCKGDGSSCSDPRDCCSLQCNTMGYCGPEPTRIPTRVLTPTPYCSSQIAFSCNTECIKTSQGGYCPTPTPTAKPTAALCPNGSVSVCTGKTIGSSCVNAAAPGMAATCKIISSSSACTCVTVSSASNTPTPTICKNIGSQCSDPRDCCVGICGAQNYCCLSNGTASKVASNCCSGYLGSDLGGNATVCATKPTSVPGVTNTPPQSSPTPTGATGTCTTISGQWCTAGLCRDKGGTVGVGVCGGGQYCCQPNTSTCVQTGGSCLTGTCCAGNQCIDQGGYPTCYKDSQIPTLFPKLTPAATVTPGTFEQCCPRYDTVYSKNTCTGASENACNINIKYCVPSTSSTCPPYEPGMGPTGGPIINPPTNTPIPGGNTCNESLTGNLLQCCHPPDSDGTSDDSLCNRAGKVATCGGKDYCCPTFNGNWTTDMSKCNLKCTMCANGKNRSIGDADCNGVVDVNDRSIWASEFVSDGGNGTVKNTWMADFDCNGVVDVNDRSIWAANFKI